jgi:hypothetical protein
LADLQTVNTHPGYKVGFLPPALCSLAPGVLFVELTPAGGGAPRLWVGAVHESGFPGNVVRLVAPGVAEPVPPSTITIDPVANPSVTVAVNITGTVAPGAEVELAAVIGANPEYYDQVTGWSPWDASGGAFDVTWYLPPGDNYFVRVRMRDDPSVFVDSNLFQVIES